VLPFRVPIHSICPIRIEPPKSLVLAKSLQRLSRLNHSPIPRAADTDEMRARRAPATLVRTDSFEEGNRLAKRTLGAVPYVYPVPIVLVGALVDGRPNYATVGDCAIMGLKPAVVAVSLGEGHYTTKGVLEHRTFSISIPQTKALALVDYFGQVSGREIDKSKLVDSFFGKLETAPMVESAPVAMECRVLHEVRVEHRCIFVGAVVQTYVEEQYVGEDGRTIAPLRDLDPILYDLGNRYSRAGETIGQGYKEGTDYAASS